MAGEQLLPVQLAVLLAGRPGLQLLAADGADHHLLLGQVQAGVADFQALQAQQGFVLRALDGEPGKGGADLAQLQLGALGQVQRVLGAEVEHAVFQHQRHGVAHVGPDALELAVADLQLAFGGNGGKADLALPVDAPAARADGDHLHVGVVVGQGAEVGQLQVQRVVDELHRLARAQVLEVQAVLDQGNAADAQRERLARLFRSGLLLGRRQLEQAGQVERAVLGEQHFGVGLFQLDIGQVHGAAPQAVQLQVGIQALEGDLRLFRLADMQAPELQLQAEGVELDAREVRRNGGQLRQLLVGDPLPDAGQDQEAEQAVQAEGDGQGVGGTLQSFEHGTASSSSLWNLEYGMAVAALWAIRVPPGVPQKRRIRVFSGGRPSREGKSAAGSSCAQSRTGRPSFSAQRST